MLREITELRKHLHKNPELSGDEAGTAAIIREFAQNNFDIEIISGLGGHGLALVKAFGTGGPTVMIRCELDALPIEEPNDFSHRSSKNGVSHKCGHDGHMAIVSGVLLWLQDQSFQKGKVILLFQPAEETGKGAFQVLQDGRFNNLNPDYVFALHNLPGEPKDAIVVVDDAFSSEVISFAVHLSGKRSHASEPENGINPALAIAELIMRLNELNIPDPENEHFTLLTPVHLKMGEKAYGISSGEGELHYTIRTRSEETMEKLKERIQNLLNSICPAQNLQFSIEWFDHFPATVNDPECNGLIQAVAAEKGYNLIKKPHPFKFGEDFGWFSQHAKAAMFGLGAGLNTPALHHDDYDFPDEILQTGIDMFTSIIKKILNASEEP